jgi:hypothetical protein
MAAGPQPSINPLVTAFIFVMPFVSLGISLVSFPVKTSLTIGSILCAWGADVFFKRVLGSPNEGMFADLSFSTFLFTASYLTTVISLELPAVKVNSPAFTQFILIIATFGAGYLLNLYVCSHFSTQTGFVHWFLRIISVTLGLASFMAILILQSNRIM